jgi:Lon-like ATP-dependent protease
VTKAHGGVLFLDEIGELHPIQMNKLLKILEDRKVFLESAYYNSEDANIPRHIHDIFQNGLPADFRLVGATTKNPEEIPPAIRSRCLEIFFRALTPSEIVQIAKNAAAKGGFTIEEKAAELIGNYSSNGREAVNIIQLSGGLVLTRGGNCITLKDVEWVINSGHYNPRPDKKIKDAPQVGYVNGLAVYGPNLGTIIEIEASAIPTAKGKGALMISGIVDEEEVGSPARRLRRRSTARGSVDNVLTVIRKFLDVDPRDYDIHINFPGGIPIDGPSAGITIATVIYSAITNKKIDNEIAMTGEVSIRGEVKPVGGVVCKIEAAQQAGVKKVLIPKDNYQQSFEDREIEIIPVQRIEEVIKHSVMTEEIKETYKDPMRSTDVLTASGFAMKE